MHITWAATLGCVFCCIEMASNEDFQVLSDLHEDMMIHLAREICLGLNRRGWTVDIGAESRTPRFDVDFIF